MDHRTFSENRRVISIPGLHGLWDRRRGLEIADWLEEMKEKLFTSLEFLYFK